MIKRTNTDQSTFDFDFTLCRHLAPDNRWVRLADQIPWDVLGAIYEESLSPHEGAPSIPARVVIGALIIKHMKNLSDEDTIEDIRENPYCQYFLGYSSFRDRQVFAPSLFVEIRKRLGLEQLQRINETFISFTEATVDATERSDDISDEDKDDSHPPNKGMLIMDATVAPQDIAYPTDVGLLNDAREKLETIIDALWVPGKGKLKPRTYRQEAHKQYLAFSRKRKPRRKTIRKAVGKQLSYVRRDLKHIKGLLKEYPATPFPLSYKLQRQLWIIKELFRQQEIMYREKTHSIAHRIVNISQPYVRPIVRGKAKAKTEFGAKISASVIDGKFVLDRLEWDAYNECTDILPAVERYKERFGYYPESVNADKIYWSRGNRRYLKSLDIALYGGKPLGRPIMSRTPQEKKIHKAESVKRNRIEGKFGTGKRRYGLGLVMAKTKATSESWIAMVIFVMNVAGVCRHQLFSLFFTLKRFVRVSFRSIFHSRASKLWEKLESYLGVRSCYQLQIVDRLQITTY